jgi:hypothetical protein
MEVINDLLNIFLISLGFLGLYVIVDQTIVLIKWIIKYATKKT